MDANKEKKHSYLSLGSTPTPRFRSVERIASFDVEITDKTKSLSNLDTVLKTLKIVPCVM